jgi:3-oxoacyl-(acyl-carrier-protein) synthase
MGVLAPNAHGLSNYANALRAGISGIRHIPLLEELKFTCQVAGAPQQVDELKKQYLSPEVLLAMNSSMVFGAIAAIDCWKDAGFTFDPSRSGEPDWDTGAIIGTGVGGSDTVGGRLSEYTNQGRVRKLGSVIAEQAMSSASSANIGGLLGLGGPVSTNSSACTTGTEALANAFFMLTSGRVKRMLAGATEGASQYTWAPFDAMRVLAKGFNDSPQQASRPMSATASGFVPGSGAGVLMLETLESALARNARIYAEIIGAHVNCGGQRQGGTITAPNPIGVQHCIRQSIQMAGIIPQDIDFINGHLTATMADVLELKNWQTALDCKPHQLPWINSTKSMIGHALGAAGSLEAIACILQLSQGFIHGSLNCEDIHPELTAFGDRIVHQSTNYDINIMAKASFGFGDVNACLIFKRWPVC